MSVTSRPNVKLVVFPLCHFLHILDRAGIADRTVQQDLIQNYAVLQMNWIVWTTKPPMKAIQTRFPSAEMPEPV